MKYEDLAKQIILAVGDKPNLLSYQICMTRLRLHLKDMSLVNREDLKALPHVLGIVNHGEDQLDVVLSYGVIQTLFNSMSAYMNDEEVLPELPRLNAHERTITPANRKSFHAQAQANAQAQAHTNTQNQNNDSELDYLCSLLDEDRETIEKESLQSDLKLLIINGPSFNFLGFRQKKIYGTDTYSDLVQLCKTTAYECGFNTCLCFQSNHEGEIVDKVLSAYKNFDGIIINPAAFTHTSVAILDALLAVDIPFIEVHITDPKKREDFRHFSYYEKDAIKTISGKGIDGYKEAIEYFAEYLKEED